MQVLSVIHGDNARSGIFSEVVQDRGHDLDEWSLAWDEPLPRPLDDYGAVFVFGGAMHADQDDRHPWLREENFFLQRVLSLGMPTLGVCLGAQLLAKAAHAPVYQAADPEVGWYSVEMTADAEDDPVLGQLPNRFDAFQWHFYTYDLPGGAEELARSQACTQAFRLGDCVWGIQFHAEVTQEQVRSWIEDDGDEVPIPAEDLLAQTSERIEGWNELGRTLCDGFVKVAERARTRTPV
ncbi:MAG: type 1 glutamine amidotransferase [Actinomycetota bacterium]|nr:type 1 glutamine amidotransferase [Actinomycetota bacterium]